MFSISKYVLLTILTPGFVSYDAVLNSKRFGNENFLLCIRISILPLQLSNQSGHAQKDDFLANVVKHLTTFVNQERLHGSYTI